MQDHYRPLLVFAGSNDPRVETQWATLVAAGTEVRERDMAVVLMTRSLTKMHDGYRPPQATFSATEEKLLRAKFEIKPNEFVVILVGKDGGEKSRWSQPVSWPVLRTLIDGMPMRQQEIRERQSR